MNLSHSEDISDDIKSIIKSFVCQMFGRKETDSVDQARLEIFVTKYKPKKGSASLNENQAKKLDSSIMPPCSKVLHQKIKRCIYVAGIWTNSLRTEPTPHLPTSFGSSDVSMLQVSGRTHLGQNQHHIFLHHLDHVMYVCCKHLDKLT